MNVGCMQNHGTNPGILDMGIILVVRERRRMHG